MWANCILLRQHFFLTLFFYYFKTPPFREKGHGEGRWFCNYRLLQCPKEAEDKITEEGKARQKVIFFFVIFYSFLNYSTIKRGTKSHRFPLVLYILLWRSRGRRNTEVWRRGLFCFVFFMFFFFFFWDGHSGLQDGVCEQKALWMGQPLNAHLYTTARTLWELIYIQEVFPGRYGAAVAYFCLSSRTTCALNYDWQNPTYVYIDTISSKWIRDLERMWTDCLWRTL